MPGPLTFGTSMRWSLRATRVGAVGKGYFHLGKHQLLHHELIILPEFIDGVAAVSLHFQPARQGQSVACLLAELQRAGQPGEESEPIFDETKRTSCRDQHQEE